MLFLIDHSNESGEPTRDNDILQDEKGRTRTRREHDENRLLFYSSPVLFLCESFANHDEPIATPKQTRIAVLTFYDTIVNLPYRYFERGRWSFR